MSPTPDPTLKVGSRIWRFDSNRRVYRKPNSFSGGGIIFEEYFQPHVITGETRQSWLVQTTTWGGPDKINKQTMLEKDRSFTYRWFSDAQKEAAIWKEHHALRLVEYVRQVDDVDKLKQIAALVGYDPLTGG